MIGMVCLIIIWSFKEHHCTACITEAWSYRNTELLARLRFTALKNKVSITLILFVTSWWVTEDLPRKAVLIRMKKLGKKMAKGGIHPSASCTHLPWGKKQVLCFYTLCWSLLLLLRLQPIIDDNMSNICWVVNVHFQFVLSGLKKPWLKEKICCHWTLWSCCPCCEQIFLLLQHIGTYSPCFDFFFFFFMLCIFFTELPTFLILSYSLIDFSVSLPALSENSLQISLNIRILLKNLSLP